MGAGPRVGPGSAGTREKSGAGHSHTEHHLPHGAVPNPCHRPDAASRTGEPSGVLRSGPCPPGVAGTSSNPHPTASCPI